MVEHLKRICMFSVAALVVLALVSIAAAQSPSDQPMGRLVAAAAHEGQLTVIALPHDWCGYADVITSFKRKYGLKVNELNRTQAPAMKWKPSKRTRATAGPRRPT